MARRNPEETRQRILQAATGLFYARGIRAVGVDAIAAEAGVTKRTMYKHFESKDALIVCYLESKDEPVLTGLKNSIANAPGDAADRIAFMFIALGERAEGKAWQGCPFARAVSELRDDEPADVAKIAGDHKHTFERWLEVHLAADGIEEAGLVARQIMVLLDGCIAQLLIHRDSSYAHATAEAARSLIRARCL